MSRNKNPDETVHLILTVAERLFMEKGYEHTSVQNIIDQLGGLSKGAIYHHFKSKEEILIAVFDRIYENSEDMFMNIQRLKGLNGKEKLRKTFAFSIQNSDQRGAFQVSPDMLKNPQLLAYLMKSIMEESVPFVQKILEEGIADGSIQTEYPQEMAEVLMLLGNIWMNPMVWHGNAQDMLRKAEFYQILLKGIGLEDVVDDEMIAAIQKYCETYAGKQ